MSSKELIRTHLFHSCWTVHVAVKRPFENILFIWPLKITGWFVSANNVRTLHSILFNLCAANSKHCALFPNNLREVPCFIGPSLQLSQSKITRGTNLVIPEIRNGNWNTDLDLKLDFRRDTITQFYIYTAAKIKEKEKKNINGEQTRMELATSVELTASKLIKN